MKEGDLSARVRRLHVKSRKLMEGFFAGSYHSVFKGPGLEFDEVREYIPGDDIRFIDWNVSSRMASPYSKVFREERELILMVLVDLSSSLDFGSGIRSKRDSAGILFALLALAAVANNDRVGSLLFSDLIERQVPPKKGRRHVLRQISEVLGFVAQGRGSNLALALRATMEHLKRKSTIVILSDFRTESYQLELSLLARKHDVIAIRLTDVLDSHFPPLGMYKVKDPETGKDMTVWSRSRRFQQRYSDFWEAKRLAWLSHCRSVGVDTLEVDTNDDPVVRLQHFFQRRKGT